MSTKETGDHNYKWCESDEWSKQAVSVRQSTSHGRVINRQRSDQNGANSIIFRDNDRTFLREHNYGDRCYFYLFRYQPHLSLTHYSVL